MLELFKLAVVVFLEAFLLTAEFISQASHLIFKISVCIKQFLKLIIFFFQGFFNARHLLVSILLSMG